jgi:hypothetical protein
MGVSLKNSRNGFQKGYAAKPLSCKDERPFGVENRYFWRNLAPKVRKIGVKSPFHPFRRWPEPRFGGTMAYEQSLPNRVCMP